MLDAVRVGPADDATEVTAAQVREVVGRLRGAGQWRPGDPPVLVVFDAGYDVTRLAWLLRDLPVEVAARVRSDRVYYLPACPASGAGPGRPSGPARADGGSGRPGHPPGSSGVHGDRQVTDTSRYGTAFAAAWNRAHQQLQRRAAWAEHEGQLPAVEGTLVRLTVDRLPGDRNPKPVWLWCSAIDLGPAEIDRVWQAYLRRFDIEHMFRFFKQALGWTRPRLRHPAAADRWTWLIIAAYTQLRLARDLTVDLRRPWERKTTAAGRLTPSRVRRGFRHLRAKMPVPASAPKPSRPGPGRPPGSRNRQVAAHPPVGTT